MCRIFECVLFDLLPSASGVSVLMLSVDGFQASDKLCGGNSIFNFSQTRDGSSNVVGASLNIKVRVISLGAPTTTKGFLGKILSSRGNGL